MHADTLQVLAGDLLGLLPGAPRGDLSAALVLLPSTRACRSLGHAILEASGRDTLLLPRIQTVTGWAREMAAACGLDPDAGPDPRSRPLILAPQLAVLPWLSENPESAPGLARELIALFDEVRLHDQAELLLDPERIDELLAMTGAAEAAVLGQDMTRVHEAWRLYRELVPHDGTDDLIALAAALGAAAAQSEPPHAVVIAAAFSLVDPTRASLLKAALASGHESRLYLPEADGLLARLFLATWGERPGATDPLAPARHVERLLTGTVSGAPYPCGSSLRVRLENLRAAGSPADLVAPVGPLELVPCGGAEAECRLIADRVAGALSGAAAAGAPTPRITVATNDPNLAARIRAHLWDAGIDADDTHGDPLSALPAGLLARFILRAALTDLRIEPLLEVLTHPYVQLPVNEGHHTKWTLRLEQMYRRDQGPRGGLAALHRRADERDESVLHLFRDDRTDPGAGMVAFVTLLADAFAPLLPIGDGRVHSWADLLSALRQTWGILAPKHPLSEFDQPRPDVAQLHQLLAQLERDAARLPSTTLAGFSSELTRLLGAESAADHRKPNLPVVIAGLVEARLERSDLLILAGLRDGVYPGRSKRPLFLSGALRERLGLPGWAAALARDAELFARLLHGAPRVLLTWSTEEDGAPALPSSFVSRLELVVPPPTAVAAAGSQWRTEPVPWTAITDAEQAFAAAERAVHVTVPIRPLTKLSWSALRTWRDCPYRYLLERGFALRREEEVQAEFQRLDFGNLVHSALQDWLEPAGSGYAALAAGDAVQAAAALDQAARDHFEQGAEDLPQRRLWFESFRSAIPGLVSVELARFPDWRPIALERGFELPLTALHEWVALEAARQEIDVALPPLPDHAQDVLLRGTVDRVDLRQDGTGAVGVIDYKTGQVPSPKKVGELEELQVLLYAVAAEVGALQLPGGVPQVSEGFYYGVGGDKSGGPAKPHLPAETEEGRRLLVDGAVRLVELAVAASDPVGEFPVLPREMSGEAPTRLPCDTCDFRGVCRVEELAVPAGTERKLDKLVNRKDMG
jgi:ATP-dependent helicase/nuclease subunit B